jgi:hypothetical protein
MRRRRMGWGPASKIRQAVARVAFYTSFTLLASCAPAAFPSYQIQQYPDIDEKTLLLDKKANEKSFIAMLREKGATNIIHSKGYIRGKLVSAVTADFMDYVYLFSEGKYLAKLEIRHDKGKPQVHPFAKIVYTKDSLGVFLVAENIELGGKRTAQLILIGKGGGVKHINISLEEFIKDHGGIWDPYVGGENLDSGVFLAGRMNTGEPWLSVYRITMNKEGKLIKEKVPRGEAAGCSCFSDWMMGKDAREVFGMKVE